MTRDDFMRFAQSLSAMSELYGKPLSEGAITLWWQALQRYDIEQIEAAIRGCVEDPEGGQFMPKPADIIKRLDGTATDRSLMAWGKVLDAMQRVGAYSSVVFDDGLIHAAVEDMGGWVKLCRSGVDELPFMQRRFCDTYRAYARRPDVRYPPRLAGEHEAQNALKGHRSGPPAIVGDPSKAQAVQRLGQEGSKTEITQPFSPLLALSKPKDAA